ncbi:MAG: metallophosphoesterase [Formivibrio sp.]|nr:metallophosphoesterase [Formivibrio sp.]
MHLPASRYLRSGALLSILGLALLTGCQHLSSPENESDPVILSFATVGDSREEPLAAGEMRDLSAQDAIWLQNSRGWSRIIDSISAQHANMLFFNGDMIMGYGKAEVPKNTSTVKDIIDSDLVRHYREFAFWRGMVARLFENGTYVVPVPGNHEVQYKKAGKIAVKENEDAWRANMGDLILDRSRFEHILGTPPAAFNVNNHPGDEDGLTTDQSQLSYSFDVKGIHFAVINTDAVGKNSHAPLAWLTSDLAAAKARGMQHFFIFGHKPAYTYHFKGADPKMSAGFEGDPAHQQAFWGLIEQYGATYFAGHEHIFNLSQPGKDKGGSAWQVMVGSGGSPFEATQPTGLDTDRMYAWAQVKVRASGKVDIDLWGFDDHYGPTQHITRLNLPH